MTPSPMSLKEYARHRGCDPKSVRVALAAGRITGERTAGGWAIDAAQADVEWEKNTRLDKAKGRRVVKEAFAEAVFPDPASADGEPDPDAVGKENSREAFNIAAAEEKRAKARLAEIEVGLKSGELVRADKVRDTVFSLMRQVRDAMLNIPDRCAANIAAASDEFEVNRLLTAEIRSALSTLAEKIRDAECEIANHAKDKT